MSLYFILKENWDFNLPFISFGFRSCFITVLKIANRMAFVGSSRVSRNNDRKRWKRILGWNWESVFICSAKWFQRSAEYGTFLTTGYFSDLKHKSEIKVFFFFSRVPGIENIVPISLLLRSQVWHSVSSWASIILGSEITFRASRYLIWLPMGQLPLFS